MTDEGRLAAAFLLAAAVVLFTTPLAIRLALRTGFLDRPHSYKAHERPTPYLGGLAVAAGIAAASAIFVAPDAPDVLRYAMATALVLCMLGTLDDRLGLGPGIRVLVTLSLGLALWLADASWQGLGHPGLDLAITCAWILGVVNAYNLMDNMDGAASTVAASAAAGLAAAALVIDKLDWAAASLAVAGATAAFLVFNLRRPARIFLGDGGSMPLGFLVAILPMTLMASAGETGWAPVMISVLFAGLPALDTALVIVSRRRHGRPVMSGGRDHLTHRALGPLGTPRRVAIVLASVQLGMGAIAAVLLSGDAPSAPLLAVTYLVIATVVIFRLERPRAQPLAGAATSPTSGQPAPEAARSG